MFKNGEDDDQQTVPAPPLVEPDTESPGPAGGQYAHPKELGLPDDNGVDNSQLGG